MLKTATQLQADSHTAAPQLLLETDCSSCDARLGSQCCKLKMQVRQLLLGLVTGAASKAELGKESPRQSRSARCSSATIKVGEVADNVLATCKQHLPHQVDLLLSMSVMAVVIRQASKCVLWAITTLGGVPLSPIGSCPLAALM